MNTPSSEESSAKPRATGVVVPHRLSWSQRLLARLLHGLAALLYATLRIRWVGPDHRARVAQEGPAIFCLWHNRLALCMAVRPALFSQCPPGRKLVALVSASRDGGLLARVLELFDVETARGSSSRRGAQALREMTGWSRRGYDMTLTPDGPRGPCYKVADGVIALAQITGRPVFPISWRVNWKIRLRSWDRFQVPLPFALCEVRLGEPFFVPREADEAEREALRARLERELAALTQD